MIVVDGNAIGYASQFTAKLTVDGQEVQAIYQFLRTLKAIKQRFGGKVVVLWDGHAKFRYDRYPDYKGKRKDNKTLEEARASWALQKPVLQQMLPSINVWQFYHSDFEADDLAGYLVRHTQSQIQLITGDEDWMQLVRENVSWHDIRSNVEKDCTHATFHKVTGYKTPAQFLYAKVLQGDTSDNIKGVGGLGEKASQALFEQFSSITELWMAYADTDDGFAKEDLSPDLRRFRKKLNDFCESGRDVFKRNLILMDLSTGVHDAKIKPGIQVTKPRVDIGKFESACRDLNFMSIATMIPDWRVFEKEAA